MTVLKRLRAFAAALVLGLALAPTVHAQQASEAWTPISPSVSISASSSSSRVAFTPKPTGASQYSVAVYNSGAVNAFVKFGSSTVTAATTDFPVQAGATVNFLVSSTTPYMAAITSSSTATLYVSTGIGIASGYGGGGSGGGGGGGAVQITSPVDAHGNVQTVIYDSSGVAITYNSNGQASAANSTPVVGATGTIAGGATGTAGTSSADVVTVQGRTGMTPVQTVPSSQYPNGAVIYTASATGTTAATAATLTGASSVTTYICGFSIRANATAAATGNATVAGTITGTMNFTQWTAPLASGLGIVEMIFTPCVPASGTNTSIVVTSAAPGSGGVVSVSAWGYKL